MTCRVQKVWGAIFLAMVTVSIAGVNAALSPAERPFLHGLFTDNMVLQRDVPCPVWGWTEPGKQVTVAMDGETASAIAGSDGKWLAKIGPFPAGGPHDLTVTGTETVRLKNVMAGDVWLCSGQSNMQMGMKGINAWWDEQGVADLPGLRLAFIPFASSFIAPNSVETSWRVSSRDAVFSDEPVVGGFSAIAFLFGRQIHKETAVPIGLIEACYGSTDVAAWSTPEAVKSLPYAGGEDRFDIYREAVEKAWEKLDPAYAATKTWSEAGFQDGQWSQVSLPSQRSGGNDVNWYRRSVLIPAAWAGHDLVVSMGPIDGIDTLWWNGTYVDSHSVIDNVMFPRFYRIPGSLVKAGPQTLALRVLGQRGIFGKPDELYVQRVDGDSARITLAGPWRSRAGSKESELQRGLFPEKRGVGAGCFQAMIAPLAPFAIKGVIWYQGEGDVGRPQTYAATFTRLIGDWRALFQSGDLPFYFVQISGFGPLADQPAEGSGWAEVREAQSQVAARVPGTGLAVSIDRGEIYNIHPPNKQDVARRLALLALDKTYGKTVLSSGPVYESMKVEGNAIRVTFRGAEGGLVAKGGVPASFEIAGADGEYVRAQGVIEGQSVLVSATGVTQPVSVRYGWADHPICNLYNAAGLPASPFRASQ